MHKIYLDTSQRNIKSIKLVEVVGNKDNVIDEISGDIDVVASLQTLLEKHRLKTSDIDEFIPFLGPGSFTGLKIGVTVANVLNWNNKKKDTNDMYVPEYGSEPNIQPKKS